MDVLLTLAEELHFGRTGERLRITTAAVSQTIARLERRIGAALFTRTSRRVELTPIGRRLVDDVAPARARVDAAMATATATARQLQSSVRVGYMSAAVGREVLLRLDTFQRSRPSSQISIVETPLTDMYGALRSDAVDLSVLPLPVREDDLTVASVIYREPAVVALPRAHRLARGSHLRISQLSEAVPLEIANVPEYWREQHHIGADDRVSEIVITGFQELLALVEAGRGVAVVGAQCASYYPRPGITYVPLVDGALFEYAAVVRIGPTSEALNDLLQHLASETSARPGRRRTTHSAASR